jgi:hypothetical protein
VKIHDWLDIEPYNPEPGIPGGGLHGYKITIWDGPRHHSLAVIVSGREDVGRLREAVGVAVGTTRVLAEGGER